MKPTLPMDTVSVALTLAAGCSLLTLIWIVTHPHSAGPGVAKGFPPTEALCVLLLLWGLGTLGIFQHLRWTRASQVEDLREAEEKHAAQWHAFTTDQEARVSAIELRVAFLESRPLGVKVKPR